MDHLALGIFMLQTHLIRGAGLELEAPSLQLDLLGFFHFGESQTSTPIHVYTSHLYSGMEKSQIYQLYDK